MDYLMFLLPIVLVLLCASNRTWAPLQSDQVRDICSHMTVAERRQTAKRGAVVGLLLGGCFSVVGVLGMPLGRWLFDSSLMGIMIVQPVAVLVVGVLLWKLKPRMDQSQRTFLASTQWSQGQGVTPNSIELRKS